MTRRSIAIEPREMERRFVLSHPLDCDRGSLNQNGMEKVPPSDQKTGELLRRFLRTVPEVFCLESLGPREFLVTLRAGRRWYDDEFKVVDAFASEVGWESGSFTVDAIPIAGYAQIRAQR